MPRYKPLDATLPKKPRSGNHWAVFKNAGPGLVELVSSHRTQLNMAIRFGKLLNGNRRSTVYVMAHRNDGEDWHTVGGCTDCGGFPVKPKITVPRSRLSILRMGNGSKYEQEFGHDYVVCDGMVKHYVGIGWLDVRKATKQDYLTLPVAVEEDEE